MKNLVISAGVILMLGIGGFAPRTQAQSSNNRQPPLTALQNALGLTDAQVSAIQALIQTSRQQAQPIITDAAAKRKALNALLTATPPDPTSIGNAALAVHADETQLQSLRTALMNSIANTLTPAQQSTFQTLINAHVPIPGVGGPGFGGFGPFFRGGPRGGE